jgi:hypothetical protein
LNRIVRLAFSLGICGCAAVFSAIPPLPPSGGASDGTVEFRAGAYKSAIPLLEKARGLNSQNATVASDLLSALVYEGKTAEAQSLAETLSLKFRNSPEALAAQGDLAFYLGDVVGAEQFYKAALQKKEPTARAYLGLYRLYRSASLHHRARFALLRAYELDPGDARIQQAWLSILTPEKRKEFIQEFLKTHSDAEITRDLQDSVSNGSEMAKALQGRQPDLLEGEHTATTIHLEDLRFRSEQQTRLWRSGQRQWREAAEIVVGYRSERNPDHATRS